ncbi:hypothetical protein [Streptomyces gossypiisoli]
MRARIAEDARRLADLYRT